MDGWMNGWTNDGYMYGLMDDGWMMDNDGWWWDRRMID